jgi:tetratricopeptide (TPR) repeat protein
MRSAWFKAVECEPSNTHIEGLVKAHKAGNKSPDVAHEIKEKGSTAMRAQEFTSAIANFTVAIAMLPQIPAQGDDPHALLRSVLFANRSAAFAKLRLWYLALTDAQLATQYKPDYAKAHCRLGVAALGCEFNEQAYTAFATALREEEKNRTARRGREVCLGTFPTGESQAVVKRRRRFLRDANRPSWTTRVFALSDVHFDRKGMEDWVRSIHTTKFLDDVFIVAGNLADSYGAVKRGLTALRGKCRRMFYVPGNHEMWINKREAKTYPDSLCKLWAILELCDTLDIDVFPAAICRDAFIVPLFSWYNAEFHVKDPYPDPKSEHDKFAKWPIDAQQQVWRYMLALNRAHLQMPYHGTVITFSHFVPRVGLPIHKTPGHLKTSGCAELDEQIRDVKSKCHIYGHTDISYSTSVEGVLYVHCPTSAGEDSRPPIMCVFNGSRLCHDWIDT